MAVINENLVAAQAFRTQLAPAIEFFSTRIIEDQVRIQIARAALKVTDIHRDVALWCRIMEDGDVLVRAMGDDVWEAGRRALVFRDAGSGAGWSVRLHFRPNVKKGGFPKDPGVRDFPDRVRAMRCAMDWAAVGDVTGVRDYPSIGPVLALNYERGNEDFE